MLNGVGLHERRADVDDIRAVTSATACTLERFQELVRTREAHVGIIGLGYAGLPLAMTFAEAGFRVTGVDIDEERVRKVNADESYLVDVPADRYAGAEGRLSATTDFSAVADMDALTICVPTPLSKTWTPDLRYVLAATRAVAEHLRPGQLVVLQSTTHPGTTEEVVLPILSERGGEVGEDFFVGYAPERVDPGNGHWTIRNTPKIVSGVTEGCLERTGLLYESVIDTVVPASRPMVAETAKLHENTFRAVNIALANELALMCDRMGISAWEVIETAATKPFGFLPHYPGPGLGGDCIPVVPHFLAARAREYGYSAQLISAAHEINQSMPVYVLQKIADALNEDSLAIRGSKVLLLGMAYKPDVSDTRESPSLEIMRQLVRRGADVSFCDPHVPSVRLDGETHIRARWEAGVVEGSDCVVLLTAHSLFRDVPLWSCASRIVDTRNVVPDDERVVRL